jgi:hypothetical protein
MRERACAPTDWGLPTTANFGSMTVVVEKFMSEWRSTIFSGAAINCHCPNRYINLERAPIRPAHNTTFVITKAMPNKVKAGPVAGCPGPDEVDCGTVDKSPPNRDARRDIQ